MKMLIVIHTQSGNTARCARAIADKCRAAGHTADIEFIRTESKVTPGSTDIKLKNAPVIPGDIDRVIFGAPVWAFRASPVIMTYLNSLKDLKKIKVMNYVTKFFPFNWTGGTSAINTMNSAVATANGTVVPGKIITMTTRSDQKRVDTFADDVLKSILV